MQTKNENSSKWKVSDSQTLDNRDVDNFLLFCGEYSVLSIFTAKTKNSLQRLSGQQWIHCDICKAENKKFRDSQKSSFFLKTSPNFHAEKTIQSVYDTSE